MIQRFFLSRLLLLLLFLPIYTAQQTVYLNSSCKGAPLELSLGEKCNARFIKKKKTTSKKVLYNPVDVRISVSNKCQV